MLNKLLIILFFVSFLHPAFADDFVYQHAVIHPACVALFDNNLSDKPLVQAINLDACQQSNMAAGKILKDVNGGAYYFINHKNSTGGYYGYQLLNNIVLDSDRKLYFIKTYQHTGGTGIFNHLLLVELIPESLLFVENNPDLVHNNDRNNHIQTPTTRPLIMKLLGYIQGGDRCMGDFISVNTNSNNSQLLQIKIHNGKNPGDCSADAVSSISIHLKQLR